MKLSPRETRVVAIGAAVALLIIVWFVAVTVAGKKAEMSEAYELKQELVKRYLKEVGTEQALMERLDAMEKEVSAFEAGFLSAASPVLATANLQSIVEGVLKPRKVEIKNIKALKAKESGDFTAVGVEVTFNSETSTLVDILYDIENHKEAVYIDNISVRLQGGGMSPMLRVVMGVGAGFRPGAEASDGIAKPTGRLTL